MKKKRVKFTTPDVQVTWPEQPVDSLETEQQQEAFVTRQVEEPERRAERVSIPLDEKGAVNWDGMRPDTREKVINAFANDPESLKAIGLASPLLAPGQGITDENARQALKIIAIADGYLASFVLRIFVKFSLDADVARDAFTFSDKQLDEMSPRAARLANKYSSAVILKYQDEIALLGMFGLYLFEQMKTAIMTQAMRNMVKKQQEKPSIQVPPEGATQPVNGGMSVET
jgi:hypothetical protein